jgi:hypothetical protein
VASLRAAVQASIAVSASSRHSPACVHQYTPHGPGPCLLPAPIDCAPPQPHTSTRRRRRTLTRARTRVRLGACASDGSLVVATACCADVNRPAGPLLCVSENTPLLATYATCQITSGRPRRFSINRLFNWGQPLIPCTCYIDLLRPVSSSGLERD